MISSLLTMANNALLYNTCKIPQYLKENLLRESQEEDSLLIQAKEESSSVSESSSDKFRESLIESLKENGLTSSQGVEKIKIAAETAQAIVTSVKENEGSSVANQFKALILTKAQSSDAEGLLSAVVENFVAGTAIQMATESNETTRKALEEQKERTAELKLKASKDEIAKKAEEKIEKSVEEKVVAASDKAVKEEEIALEEESIDLVATIKSTIEDVKKMAFGSDDVTVAVQDIIQILNKVKADLGQNKLSSFSNYDIEEELTSLRNLNFAQTSVTGFGAYASRSPMPGSLLSLTV
jgi:hypothetical protein